MPYQYQSPGLTQYRRAQVGGLHRYLRPLGSTWLIAALGVLVVAAGWVLYGMAPALLATAERTSAPVAAAQETPGPAGPEDAQPASPASPDNPPPAATAPATESVQKLWLQVTAYCPCSRCCGAWAYRMPRRFADGTPLAGTDFALAADPGVFPFGTRIRVPGYASGEPVPVLDVGTAVRGQHVEIFLHGDNAHRRAKQWGSRWMEVEVLDR